MISLDKFYSTGFVKNKYMEGHTTNVFTETISVDKWKNYNTAGATAYML